MNCFVDIQSNTDIARGVDIKLMSELSAYMNESNLTDDSNIAGVRAVINPPDEMVKEAQQINTILYWIAYSNNLRVNDKTFYNFKLRCLHLSALTVSSIERILLILVPADAFKEESDRDVSKQEHAENESTLSFDAIAPKYSLDKVVMNEANRSQIQRAISLVNSQKMIFGEWGFSEIDPHTKTILCFYGQPGTGKTMCAHALARALGKKIIIASYAAIESKWVGEGPKNLKKIFKDAGAQDAVLFFDEADSFLSKRINSAETGSDKHYNRMTNEMFQLLEDYNGVIVFATNLVQDFDKAFKSRILAFVEFQKPDYETRIELIKVLTPAKVPLAHPLSEEEHGRLSAISDGFSGREIRKAVLTSLAFAAEKGLDELSFAEFEYGFDTIRNETISIEKSMEEDSSNYMKDFLIENETNGYIMDVCLKTLWQGEMNDKQKKYIYQVSKLLNLSMPDLTISYRQKLLDDATANINSAKRQCECLKHVCEILSISDISDGQKHEFLQSLSLDTGDFGKDEMENYLKMLTIINQHKILSTR